MPDIDQKNGIDMANIASINGQDIAGGAYDPLTDTGTYTETVPTTGMIMYGGGINLGRTNDTSLDKNFLKGPAINFSSDKDGVERISQQNTKNWTKFQSSSQTLAGIDTDGKLWMCGSATNRTHQSTNITTLTQVTGVGDSDTGWTDVSVGSTHVMAINSGKLYGLGRNSDNELGLTSSGYSTLTQVGTDTDWQLISCGYSYSLAVKGASGSMALYSVGNNGNGRTGQGTTSGDTTTWTEAVASDSDDYTFIEASVATSLAIKGGKVYMVGEGNQELQGNNSTADTTTFAQTGKIDASTFGTNWTSGSVSGTACSYLINSSGELWFAGEASKGHRGDGTNTDAKNGYHVKVSGTGDSWTQICRSPLLTGASATKLQVAGIESGQLYVWGNIVLAYLGTTSTTAVTNTFTPIDNTNTCAYASLDDGNVGANGGTPNAASLVAAFNT